MNKQNKKIDRYRVCAVGVVRNDKGEYLICKKPKGRGVYPGQWALPGGGIDDKETMELALRREIEEEVGIEIDDIKPLYFRDDVQDKFIEGKVKERIYMIYLLFECKARNNEVVVNEEFEDFAWVMEEDLNKYNLNKATIYTFEYLGVMK